LCLLEIQFVLVFENDKFLTAVLWSLDAYCYNWAGSS
jgi:hypothetical protein